MSESTSERYLAHLNAHLGQYYPDLDDGSATFRLLDVHEGKSSHLFRFEVDHPERARRVLVKLTKPETGRYRLARQTPPKIKLKLEYQALAAIHDHFHDLDPACFRTVRPLDFIEPDSALVVEESPDPSFRNVFHRASRLKPWLSSPDLDRAFHNAGRWLRAYSHLPQRRNVEIHESTREDLLHALGESCESLAASTNRKASYFRDLFERTKDRAHQALPGQLPVGLKHGDYALRNLLLGADGSVTALDTQAKWRTPIYEDVAYFLVELDTNWPQVLSQGWAFRQADLHRWGREFLRGYFDPEPVPAEPLRVFVVKVMVRRWAAHLFRVQGLRRDGRTTPRTLLLPMTDRYFRRYLDEVERRTFT